MTATKTRKKQQTELIKLALEAKEDQKRNERESFLITAIPINIQAAHESSMHHGLSDPEYDEGLFRLFKIVFILNLIHVNYRSRSR